MDNTDGPMGGPMMRGGLAPLFPRNRQVSSVGHEADTRHPMCFGCSVRSMTGHPASYHASNAAWAPEGNRDHAATKSARP